MTSVVKNIHLYAKNQLLFNTFIRQHDKELKFILHLLFASNSKLKTFGSSFDSNIPDIPEIFMVKNITYVTYHVIYVVYI